MGLMDRVRGQFIDIVEFLDDSRDTIVWRFPRQGNEIKMGAQLVVREGQNAVFVNEGTIADVFTPGTYTLETRNMPILSDLKGWKYGFNSPFKAEVYFVSTRQFTDLKWGTQNPVTMRDPEFGVVRLRAFGAYAIQVVDPAKLLRQLAGTDPQFRTEEVSDFVRETIVSQVGTALGNSHLPMLDLAANQQTIAATLAGTLTTNLADMGISVPRLVIQNISLPPEVEAVLDKRTSINVVGNLDQYAKFQSANAIEDAANNPSGGNSGLGLGVGVALGQQIAGALAPGAAAAPATAGPPPLPGAAAPLYLGIGGQQVGPVDPAGVQARIASGEVTTETLVWRQGMAGWVAAGTLPEIAALFAAATPPPSAAPAGERRMTAPTPPPLPASEPAGTAAAPETPDAPGAAAAPRFTCSNCGAQTHYAPGTSVLKCSACGTEQAIEDDRRAVVEHSYDEWADLPPKPVASIGKQVLHCQNCGASTETDLLADRCQFCDGVLIALTAPPGLIVPEAVVPFGIDQGAANEAFGTWVRSRWFAPNALKKVGSTEAIKGTYVPHWTYDAQTETRYVGQRGEHYWVTVTRTVSDGQGGTRQEDVQEMRTRWWPASGQVARDFDDVVVRGSHQLSPKRLEQAGPWDLTRAVAYRPEFLAGYSALRYDVDPDVGLQDARGQMESVVEQDCRADIGGDEQIVGRMDVRYAAMMFKLVLLPLWIASYLHGGKTFQILVNANTGEVVGDRPISKVKVALAVLAALIVIAVVLVIYLANHKSGSS